MRGAGTFPVLIVGCFGMMVMVVLIRRLTLTIQKFGSNPFTRKVNMSTHYRTTSDFVSTREMIPTRPNLDSMVSCGGTYDIELIGTAANADRIFWTWKITVGEEEVPESARLF